MTIVPSSAAVHFGCFGNAGFSKSEIIVTIVTIVTGVWAEEFAEGQAESYP